MVGVVKVRKHVGRKLTIDTLRVNRTPIPDGVSELHAPRRFKVGNSCCRCINKICIMMPVEYYTPFYPDILTEQGVFLAGAAAEDLHIVHGIARQL